MLVKDKDLTWAFAKESEEPTFPWQETFNLSSLVISSYSILFLQSDCLPTAS